MVRIPEILNHSDELSEDSGSTTPSSMSLMESSSSVNTASGTPLTSYSNGSSDKLSVKRLKTEPKVGLADEVKQSIESDLPKRFNHDPSSNMVTDSDSDTSSKEDNYTQKLKFHFPTTLPVSKINKKLLQKKLVQIAIRRKSITQLKDPLTNQPISHTGSKLHTKSLEAGLRVKLTLAPDLYSLYNSLTPHTNRKQTLLIYNSNVPGEAANGIINNDNYLNDVQLNSKTVQLIDNNLVNLSVFSNKILKSFKGTTNEGTSKSKSRVKNSSSSANSSILPTFNSLDTAVHNLFGINEYSLVRITRSTTTDQDGSILLKFETAKPGELNLIDDEDFADDLLHSIGKPNDVPSNIFIKKVIARPRYKSDMKIYLIPKNVNSSLYVDKRMFERDLINGIVDVHLPFYKNIYCTFDFAPIVNQFMELLELSKRANHDEHNNQSNPSQQRPPNYLPIQNVGTKPVHANGKQLPPVTVPPPPQHSNSYPNLGSNASNPLVSPPAISPPAISPGYGNKGGFFGPQPSLVLPPICGPQLPPIQPNNSAFVGNMCTSNSLPSIPTFTCPNPSPTAQNTAYAQPVQSPSFTRLPPIIPQPEKLESSSQ